VPVTREPYDLVMAAETVEDPVLAPLWELLGSPAFLERVEALGGYSTEESGRRVR
jgi:putative molybdopterin biosynthesis protein